MIIKIIELERGWYPMFNMNTNYLLLDHSNKELYKDDVAPLITIGYIVLILTLLCPKVLISHIINSEE